MRLTQILLKKSKSKDILVLMESVVSGHKYIQRRERLSEKLELFKYDPYIQQTCLYRERKKVVSIK
ncbi:39S ribosomal protein L33, mitochondrial [Lutzomyia longipalpis]|uniref:39S ribosomal protein L33, mitochondrial n=1 Tax=Lutzomyia longipalpis TaxID=7200 RepID=UPI002483DBAA|nr:39S ribosomal protein L33, mitochondrial [Lutzomyia longipalpis]